MSATATISEYERQRAQRIHDNQMRIKQLGIAEAAAAVRPKLALQAAPRSYFVGFLGLYLLLHQQPTLRSLTMYVADQAQAHT